MPCEESQGLVAAMFPSEMAAFGFHVRPEAPFTLLSHVWAATRRPHGSKGGQHAEVPRRARRTVYAAIDIH